MSTESMAVLGAASGAIGALTGVLALVWQIMTHRRSGPLVAVVASYAMPVYDGPHPFRGDDQISIKAVNRGGAPVTVTNYGIAMGEGNLYVHDRVHWSTPLPAVLEPGGKPVELMVPVAELRREHAQRRIPYTKMRPWVELGDGRRVFAKNTVPLK